MESTGSTRTRQWCLLKKHHGTSTARLKHILNDGRLRKVAVIEQDKVSLTTERDVAEYWARLSVFSDNLPRNKRMLQAVFVENPHKERLFSDADITENRGVILVLDGIRLATNYKLTPFSDDVWGPRKCDWENEIACWGDIALEGVLIAVELIGPETEDEKRKRQARKRAKPRERLKRQNEPNFHQGVQTSCLDLSMSDMPPTRPTKPSCSING
jgi:hypothetical protein